MMAQRVTARTFDYFRLLTLLVAADLQLLDLRRVQAQHFRRLRPAFDHAGRVGRQLGHVDGLHEAVDDVGPGDLGGAGQLVTCRGQRPLNGIRLGDGVAGSDRAFVAGGAGGIDVVLAKHLGIHKGGLLRGEQDRLRAVRRDRLFLGLRFCSGHSVTL